MYDDDIHTHIGIFAGAMDFVDFAKNILVRPLKKDWGTYGNNRMELK